MYSLLFFIVPPILVAGSVICTLLMPAGGKTGRVIAKIISGGIALCLATFIIGFVTWMMMLYRTYDSIDPLFILAYITGVVCMLAGTIIITIGGVWTLVVHFRK